MVRLEVLRVLCLKPCNVGSCTFANCPMVGCGLQLALPGSPQATCCVAEDLHPSPNPERGAGPVPVVCEDNCTFVVFNC